METIIVQSQKDIDELPNSFKELTVVSVLSRVDKSNKPLLIRRQPRNSYMEIRGRANVEIYSGSATVSEHAVVIAYSDSTIKALGNSTVLAKGETFVCAKDNAIVEAYDLSRVLAKDSARVIAMDYSAVEARNLASVIAWNSAFIRCYSLGKIVLHGHSVCMMRCDNLAKVDIRSKHAHLQTVKDLDWFENNSVDRSKDRVILYKRVSKDFKTQEGTPWETNWKIGKTIIHPAWNPTEDECGDGKFHGCSEPYFCDEFRSKSDDRYIAIEVKKEDLYEWDDKPLYPHKIGFRAGKVLYEVDRLGRKKKKGGRKK